MAYYRENKTRQQSLEAVGNEDVVIFYDCETTGLSPMTNHIIQLSAIKARLKEGDSEIVEEKNWYINPGYALPETIVNLTGITDELLSGKPSEREVAGEIADFFDDYPVAGYNNAKFDDAFMQNLFLRNGRIFSPAYSLDVFKLAGDILTPRQVSNYKLKTVADFLLKNEDIKFHDASGDVYATLKSFDKLVSMLEKKLKKADNYENKIIVRIKSISPWTNPRRATDRRIYVETDKQTFWFDTIKCRWHIKGDKEPLEKYDMEDFISNTYQEARVDGLEEFRKIKDKIRCY